MSFTKSTLTGLEISIDKIRKETYNDNDLTPMLEALNLLMDIAEKVGIKDKELEFYWNEIISDAISIIYSGISGQYRLAIAGLRNTLELSCSAFFYYDHKIELHLFIKENFKADKYVSTMIKDYDFFKTQYIRAFNPDIDMLQKETDSVSSFLNTTYAKLSDVVHGRYQSLTKTNSLTIDYSKEMFKKFEISYMYTMSAIAALYLLRFNDFSNTNIVALAKRSGAFKI